MYCTVKPFIWLTFIRAHIHVSIHLNIDLKMHSLWLDLWLSDHFVVAWWKRSSNLPRSSVACQRPFSPAPLSLWASGIINVVAFSWILTSLSPALPRSLIGAIGLGLRPDREAEKEENEWACSFTSGWVWALAFSLQSLRLGRLQQISLEVQNNFLDGKWRLTDRRPCVF